MANQNNNNYDNDVSTFAYFPEVQAVIRKQAKSVPVEEKLELHV